MLYLIFFNLANLNLNLVFKFKSRNMCNHTKMTPNFNLYLKIYNEKIKINAFYRC